MTDPAPDLAAEWLSAGERLGDFEVEGPLGRGGMGLVYIARQGSLGRRRVALKVLRTEHAANGQARFRREVELLAQLHHDHLAEVHGFGEEQGRLFYAMRLVDGPTLHDVIVDDRNSETGVADPRRVRRCVRWIGGVAAALRTVHEHGLVHRDVKPANVVLDASRVDHAVLVDFGLARTVGLGSPSLTAPAATLAFAPAEQILGRPPSPASDVFALGVTLHDLLTARVPDDRHQASAGLEPLAELLPEVDPDIAAVVAKATDPMAEWRYPHAGEFCTDLEAWLTGRPVSARRPPPLERLRRWARANPARIVRTIGALLAMSMVAIGVATTLDWVGAVRSLRRGGAEMDLLAVSTGAQAVPSALVRLLVGDLRTRELARRLKTANPLDPIVNVAAALGQTDEEQALLLAVTSLRRDGLDAHPLLVDFLEQSLRPETAAPGPAHQLVARLFYERPDLTEDEQAASTPLRRALLSNLEALGEGGAHDRNYALTALSGCGRAQDVSAVWRLRSRHAGDTETQRLATLCIERIVRRSHRCGGLTPELVSTWTHEMGEALAEALTQTESRGERMLAEQTIQSLAFAARAVDRREEIFHLLPEPSASSSGAEPSWLPRVLAGDPATLERLRRGHGTNSSPSGLGILVPAIPDERLRAKVEQRVLTDLADNPTQLIAYQRGVERFEDLAQGRASTLELDADSLLGSPAMSDELHQLELAQRTGDDGTSTWNLDQCPPFTTGNATGLTYSCGTFHPQGPEHIALSFLRLWGFGQSQLNLHFKSAPRTTSETWVLRLWHVAAARSFYPGSGEVYLTAYLDGRTIGEIYLPHVPGIDWMKAPSNEVLLPVQRLEPGAHVLQLRLSSRTTTTYRLIRAELVPRP